MLYRLWYQNTQGNEVHFRSHSQGVRMTIPLSELNPAMLEELKKEDPELLVEVTVLKVDLK